MLKGKMISKLKSIGVRHFEGKKLEHLKTHEVHRLFLAKGFSNEDVKLFS